jgi:threonine/homoserine/homoserine lactone efflux protein
MSFELWLAFVGAAMVMLIIPGPTVVLVVGYALGQGRRAAWAVVAGVALGDFTAMTLSLLGLGAVLAASATLFTAVKLAGAAYLVYLGIRLWRARPSVEADGVPAAEKSQRAMLGHAFAVTALNPKGIIFYVAFLPQFVDPAGAIIPQLIVLEATLVTLATLNAAAYAVLAGRARGAIRRPDVLRTVNRIGGGLLMTAGLATAATALKRS